VKSARITFVEFGLSATIFPATTENAAYSKLLEELTTPYQLAMSLDKLSDETAAKIHAEVYAKTVVAEHADLSEDDWMQWLLGHPDEFERLVFLAEHPDLWEGMSDGGQHHA
jgi:hypothetical protein